MAATGTELAQASQSAEALARARRWQEKQMESRREGAALRKELLEALLYHERARDLHAKRAEELAAALRSLPVGDDTAEIAATENAGSGSEASVQLPPNPSATQLVRYAVVELGRTKGHPTPAQIVSEAHRLSPQFSPRALYNAIHRLTTIKHLSGIGDRGDRTYSITEKGLKAAQEVEAE